MLVLTFIFQTSAASGDIELTESRLLALPPELRTKIYGFALTQEDDITLSATLREPGLLSTTRQIRKEAR